MLTYSNVNFMDNLEIKQFIKVLKMIGWKHQKVTVKRNFPDHYRQRKVVVIFVDIGQKFAGFQVQQLLNKNLC